MTTIAPCGDLHVGPRIGAIAANTVVTKIAASVRAFWSDTDGVILPYVTLMLVVIIGCLLYTSPSPRD